MTPLRTPVPSSPLPFFFNGSSKQNDHDSDAPFVSRTVFFHESNSTALLCRRIVLVLYFPTTATAATGI